MMKPFGGQDSVDYAAELWTQMTAATLAGNPATDLKAVVGMKPHGAIVSVNNKDVTVMGNSGAAWVKKNFGGADITVAKVEADPASFLKAITMIYQREAGYDTDNKDLFWAKYKADGSLHENAAGVPLAGRVAKGKAVGCISCHGNTMGGDYLFANDK